MKRSAIALAFLLSSFTLAAQNGSPSGAASVAGMQTLSGNAVAVRQPMSGCPIGMQASQGVWNHTIAVQKGLGNQKFGQRLALTLKDSRHAGIAAATVRVHGLTDKSRVVQAGNDAATQDAATTVRLSFGSQEESGVTGDLWIPGFTAVTSVELQEVSYRDGSAWRVSGSDICRVQPDPVMLISNR